MSGDNFADRLAGYSVVRIHGLGDVLREHRRSRPACVAVIEKDRRLTYEELDQRTNRLAGLLRAAGIGGRGRVLWLGQNSMHLLEGLLACAKVGAILCSANWRISACELAHVLGDFDPQLVLWQELDIGANAHACRANDPAERIWIQHDGTGPDGYEALLTRYPDHDDDERISADEPLLALYSAAFDGVPQAALLAHSAILYQGLIVGRAQDISHRSVVLNSGPLFHLGTMMGMFATFQHGGTNVFIRRMDAETLLKTVERHRVTHAFVPRPTLEQIRKINADGRYDISSLFASPDASDWTSHSAMCAPKHAPIMQTPGGYGQTEVMGHVVLRCFGGDGGAGRPSPMVQVRIADESGAELPVGETGEILVRGPLVMIGYYSADGPSASREKAGWHRTNDLGRRLPDGSICFIGPKQAMIKSGKENIYSVEVEQCLRQHPSVQDACVIGVPDLVWQQNVKAVIELKPTSCVQAEELIRFCGQRLASYKKPKIVEFTRALPRLPDGRIDRAVVDSLFGGGGYPAAY
jgi:acyl-CoA synthetase (AMP-forming)/AMP-acid ligase II